MRESSSLGSKGSKSSGESGDVALAACTEHVLESRSMATTACWVKNLLFYESIVPTLQQQKERKPLAMQDTVDSSGSELGSVFSCWSRRSTSRTGSNYSRQNFALLTPFHPRSSQKNTICSVNKHVGYKSS